MNDNRVKNVILAVLVVGIVGMTVAFAALTQQLNITDNVATVSSNWRVRFAPTVTTSVGTTIAGTTTGATYTSNTPIVTNDYQTITGLQATFTKPGDYVEVAFTVRNEGNIAAKGSSVTLNLGDLTCAPGSGSSVSQEAANSFCTNLVKWVKHSDRVTDWTSADTLAAYSGSGNDYPSIDGILRIEYPSTLTNSDIALISGGSIVVTLGDTTLNFEQDDNVTAQSGGNNQTGGGNEQGGNNQSGGNQEEQSGNYVYKLWGDWSEDLTGVTHIYNKVHDFYLRKNTDTNKIEACAELSDGLVCVDNHAFDCTLTYNNQDSKWECNDTSSYVYQKQIELENKGATCEFYSSSWSYMSCFDNSNGRERGCSLSTHGNECGDPMKGHCIMTDPVSDSYCTDD